MKGRKKQEGQTVIETALLMMLILILIFGIAEIARAWWYKSQLSNAARVGARVAVVEKTLKTGACSKPDNNVVKAACDSITSADLRSSATVTVSEGANSGDDVTVLVSGEFKTVVPGLASIAGSLVPGTGTLQAQIVMRHE